MAILIAGAGIGGLTAALSLHAAGCKDVRVLEAAQEIRQLGVGVNLPPHAVRELVELDLGPKLDEAGIRTSELAYYDTAGRLPLAAIFDPLRPALADPFRHGEGTPGRGRRAHRPARARLRGEAGRAGRGLRVGRGGTESHATGLLIAVDGIRSAVRAQLYPEQSQLAWNGWMMYRGTTRGAPFLSGTSMAIIGDEHLRVVVYPIGLGLKNWLLSKKLESGDASELGNWNRELSQRTVAGFVDGWRFDWLDVPAMIAASDAAYEYPMADFDPCRAGSSAASRCSGKPPTPCIPSAPTAPRKPSLTRACSPFSLPPTPTSRRPCRLTKARACRWPAACSSPTADRPTK
ncbi:MAG: hypothetical protein MO853_01620 [Candidatus Protistobacter heckmanni]|nr:hypothetical protein [Candidatus Protistobacter heckmanni]